MPEEDGITFLSKVAINYPETIRIILTGHSDSEMVFSAINQGRIWAFIEKPWDSKDLINTLQQAIQTRIMILNRVNHLYHDLKIAKQNAEAASIAKSEFLAVMSHEIRSPMNAILGSLDLLSETKLSDKQRVLLENAENAGLLMLKLISDILDYSKIEAGKLNINNDTFQLSDIVNTVHSIIQANITEKNLEMNIAFESDVPEFIISDAQRIEQILLNLVGNAIKFTMKGSIDIHVSFKQPDQLHFSIRDTGIGIKKGDIDLLFGKFIQANSSYQRQFDGTGLGLAISKERSRNYWVVKLVLKVPKEKEVTSGFICQLKYQLEIYTIMITQKKINNQNIR